MKTEKVLVHVVQYKETEDSEWKTGIRVGEAGHIVVDLNGRTTPKEIYDINPVLSNGCFVVEHVIDVSSCPYTEADVTYLKDDMKFTTSEEGKQVLKNATKLLNSMVGTLYSDIVKCDIVFIKARIEWIRDNIEK